MDSNLQNILKQNEELENLFTRREEYSPMFLDSQQRFPYYFCKNRDILEPRVSALLVKNGLRIDYPEERGFAVNLTHDIDSIYFSRSEIGFICGAPLIRGQVRDALRAVSKMIANRKILWNFEDIMQLEEKYGAKSSFYFMALENQDVEFNYRINDLENTMGNIIDKGWEVGLHGGHKAYNDVCELKKQKQRLERVLKKNVVGYRSHRLLFNIPNTWKILSQAGFKYDTTFGYNDMVGFRNGMCHPFRPFNLLTGKEIDIVEIPLTIQEVTLGEMFMRLDAEKALEVCKYLIDIVEKYHGVITILWHNTHLLDDKMNSILSHDKNLDKKFYEKILQYAHGKNAWITSGAQISKLFCQNK